ncbi:ATP synthase A1 subunit C [Candidatus Micrarchaeota archaeon]|nr:MAG: ATP synthase A1 subunit C [Candidatus Micrarchaeota archaeon]
MRIQKKKHRFVGVWNWMKCLTNFSARQMLRYAYSNARVKGMRSHLMSRQQMDEMIGARSVDELMGMLNNMGYRKDFIKPAVRYGGADLVELALGRNLARTFTKVMKFTPACGRETIGALIDRWDVHNIKTILLAKSMNEENARIEPFLVNAGSLEDEQVSSLLRCEGVKDVVENLRNTRYYLPLIDKYDEYGKQKEISILLSALDSFYYTHLPSRIQATHKDEQVILKLVESEVDMKNVMNILRAKKGGIKVDAIRGMLFEGGTLSRRELEKMAEAESLEEAVASLKRRYELSEAYENFKKDNSLTHFEVALERRIVEQGIRALRMSILSVGAIASFIFLKEEETNNIRKIVRGIEFEIPRDEIREMVIPIGG